MPGGGDVVIGILAGGRGRRMGGRDKAALPAPGSGEPLLSRLLRLGEEIGVRCVVVGGEGRLSVPRLRDEPAGVGPIGGLCALLSFAAPRQAIALACDLPHLTPALLARLVHADSPAAVLAAREPSTGKWEPLFARYDAVRVLPPLRAAIAAGTRSMQTVLRALDVQELPVDDAERAQLRDWDVPADIGS